MSNAARSRVLTVVATINWNTVVMIINCNITEIYIYSSIHIYIYHTVYIYSEFIHPYYGVSSDKATVNT